MINGTFVDGNKPMVEATIAHGQAVQNPFFVLDTGFTGDLAVTDKVAKDLGFDPNNPDFISDMRTADHKLSPFPSVTALASMEGKTLYVTLVIKPGLPLLGISFMEKFGYKAIVDCKNKKVSLEVAS
jgi:predicted aspartyl protease